MKKCPTCDSSFSDDQLFCPNCGTKLEETVSEPAPAPTKKSGVSFVIMLSLWVVTVCVAAYAWNEKSYYYDLYNSYSLKYYDADNELSQVKSELEKLSDLEGLYGYG